MGIITAQRRCQVFSRNKIIDYREAFKFLMKEVYPLTMPATYVL